MTDSDRDRSPTAASPAPDSLAEAEDELVRAEERAEAARVRAATLRREAESDSSEESDADDGALTPARWRQRPRWPWRFRRLTRKAVGVGAAVMILCIALSASGYFLWQHRTLVLRRQHAEEFAAAAREEVATLMSIDPAHATEDLQHTIDDTTGALKSQLEATSSYMAKNAQEAQITTKATVQDVAVESMTENSAVVLVVAKSDTIDRDKSSRPTVFWRLSVNIDRDGDRLKMSKLEFVQ